MKYLLASILIFLNTNLSYGSDSDDDCVPKPAKFSRNTSGSMRPIMAAPDFDIPELDLTKSGMSPEGSSPKEEAPTACKKPVKGPKPKSKKKVSKKRDRSGSSSDDDSDDDALEANTLFPGISFDATAFMYHPQREQYAKDCNALGSLGLGKCGLKEPESF